MASAHDFWKCLHSYETHSVRHSGGLVSLMNDFASQSSRWSYGQNAKLETPARSSPSNDKTGIASEQPPPPQFMASYSSSVSSALAGIEHQLVVLRQENDMLQQQVSHFLTCSRAPSRHIAFAAFTKRSFAAARRRDAPARADAAAGAAPRLHQDPHVTLRLGKKRIAARGRPKPARAGRPFVTVPRPALSDRRTSCCAATAGGGP